MGRREKKAFEGAKMEALPARDYEELSKNWSHSGGFPKFNCHFCAARVASFFNVFAP